MPQLERFLSTELPEPTPRGPVLSKWDIYGLTEPSEATARLGGAITQVGQALFEHNSRAERNHQYNNAKGQIDTLWNQLQTFIETNPRVPVDAGDVDLATFYHGRYGDMMNKIQGEIVPTVKHRDARELIDNYLMDSVPQWQKAIDVKAYDQTVRNQKTDLNAQLETAILNKDQKEHTRLVLMGIQGGTISSAEGALQIMQATERIEKNIYDKFFLDLKQQLTAMPAQDALKVLKEKDAKGFTNFTQLDATDRRILINLIESQEVDQQEQTAQKMMADFYDGKYTDPNIVTEPLRNGLISTAFANSLRNAIIQAKEPELQPQNYIKALDAIEQLRQRKISRQEALDTIGANMDGLDKTTWKSLITDVFGAEDPTNPLNRPDVVRIGRMIEDFKEYGLNRPEKYRKDPIEVYKDITDQDKKRDIDYYTLTLRNQLEQHVKQKPDETPEQLQKWVTEVLLKPQTEDAAKSWLQKAWEIIRPATGPAAIWGVPMGLPAPEGQTTLKKPIPQESLKSAERLGRRIKNQAPDARLDQYWEQLNPKQKSDIWNRYDRDRTSIDQIIRMIESAVP